MADRVVTDDHETDKPEPSEARIPVGGTEAKAAFIRLALVVGAGTAAALLSGTGRFLLVVVAVIAAIMIHELGHFVAARLSGMKVTEYFLGFGPKLWSVRKGEVEYGIKAIPAGGYVKIVGMSNLEEVDPADEPRAYRSKNFSRKLFVAFAGPATHFVIAFGLMFAALGIVGPSEPTTQISQISSFADGPSPAAAAGFRPGDTIVGVDGQPISEWSQLKPYIASRADQPIVFDVERDGQRLQLTAAPTQAVGADGNKTGDALVGFSPANESVPMPFVSAVGESAQQTAVGAVETVKSIGKIFSPSGVEAYTATLTGTSTATEEEQAASRLMSPVGLVKAGGDAADAGAAQFLLLLFVINLFLGIFNLIPLPPFDGGHIAVATYEKIRSFRGGHHVVDYAKLLPVTYAVLLLFVAISASALWLDVTNPAPNFFE